MNKTSIAWCRNPDGTPGFSWNPIVGCSPASTGCQHCYAARLASTRLTHLPAYAGLTYPKATLLGEVAECRWNGTVRFLPAKLAEPLRRRKSAGIFVCDMGDLFHERVTNEQIAAVFGVMAACPQHTFYVCTKRAERRREWFDWISGMVGTNVTTGERTKLGCNPLFGCLMKADRHPMPKGAILEAYNRRPAVVWPLPNVVQLTSVEDQATADERIPHALATPAAVRGLSVEPLLGQVDLDLSRWGACYHEGREGRDKDTNHSECSCHLDWIVAGGESGPNARPCKVGWIRRIVEQCKRAETPCFVKQLGAHSVAMDTYDLGPENYRAWDSEHANEPFPICGVRQPFKRAGADPSEWPADLRVREMPSR